MLISSFKVFQHIAGTMSILKLNMISFNYYFQLIIQTFIGSVLVVLGLSDHYIINNYPDFELRLIVWGCVCYSIIALSIYMLLFQKVNFE